MRKISVAIIEIFAIFTFYVWLYKFDNDKKMRVYQHSEFFAADICFFLQIYSHLIWPGSYIFILFLFQIFNTSPLLN